LAVEQEGGYMLPEQKLTTEWLGDVAVLTLRGDHDLTTAGDLRAAFDALLAQSRGVVVDLTQVSFMDSGTLHALVTARARALAAGTGIAIQLGTPTARRLMRVSGVDEVFPISDSRDQALRLLAGAEAST
jgi:anti-sigma B factor antagonist